MSLKDELIAYKRRWAEVEQVVQKERKNAPIELRWQQLNTAYALAKGLGFQRDEAGEIGVMKRWAKLKEKAINHPRQV